MTKGQWNRGILLFSIMVSLSFPLYATSSRLLSLYREIRCPVCEGQSIVDSEATLAQDLRRIVSQMVSSGKSDGEIRQFLQQRYGDEILLRPPLKGETLALWGFPGMLVVLLLIFGFMRGRWQSSSKPPV